MVSFRDTLRDPVTRRDYLEELRRERVAEQEDQAARAARLWTQEIVLEVPELPPTKQASVRAPRGAADDAAIRALVEQLLDHRIADLLEAVGEVVAVERERHRKEVRRLRFAIRDLQRALRKREHDNKIRMVA